MRLRLLIAVHSGERGGAELSTLHTAERLRERHELIVAVPAGPLRERFARCGAIVPGPALLPLWGAGPVAWARCGARTLLDAMRFARLVRSERVDAVVVSSAAAVAPVLGARLAGVPVLVHLRDFPHGAATRLVYALHGQLADTVVPVSEFAAQVLPGRRRARTVQIPDGVALPAEPPPYLRGAGPLRIVAMGPLEPHKGQDVIVEALSELRRRGLSAELELVGREQMPVFVACLRSRAAVADLTVRFSGMLDDVAPALARCHVLVSASRGETLGLTVLEASAHGRPVVASRVGGLPEAVEDGVTGLLVSVGDAAELADALESLDADPTRAAAMGAEGRRRVAARYDRVRSAELIEAEVRRLAGGSAATPTISVVIAAYNAERWIAATLDSILAQTEPAHEVIVVDDGSQDGTADVLSGYAGAVHVLRQDNAGPAPAFNRAVAAATGEYVAFSGADDLWDEHKLERQAAALRAQPEIDVAFTHACFFGTENWEAGRPAAEGLLDGAAFTRAMYEIGDLIPAPTAVVRRDLFERLGGYDPDFTSEDYEFWMRALEAGARFYYDPALLVRCRRHGSNLSTDLLTVTRCCLEIHERYAHLMDDPAVVKRTLARDLFMIGRYLVDEGSPGEARHSFRDAVRQRPTPRALAWTGVLALPPAARARAVPLLVAAKRGLT